MTPDIPRRWPTASARASLASRLQLPFDPARQDWEWEVADPARFAEFLDAYASAGLTDDERFALMEVLIQCVELMGPTTDGSSEWQAVAGRLLARPDLHANSVRYWACLGADEPDGWFRVTGPMRAVWQVLQQRCDSR